ncbi:Peptidase S24-like [Sulfitobacter pontiacus]|uniref:Peptidase S24-like n=1 Tax=Sulfitobacter pontiacus TaxID=60137 RepID=A0A1H2W2E4_9RHOB|nr:S24 family peptidase [Sulfitobacter pontiacus]SDW74768.1 Peptidase S24-like [Sulfitobacter pontiacus]
MDFEKKSFEKIIADRLEELGTNAFAVEQSANLTKDAIRSVIRPDSKRSLPRIDKALKICEALGLELYIGPPRSSNEPDHISSHRKVELFQDFAFVERFDVSLSAGPGTSGENAQQLAPVAFRRDWMIERGLVAEKCVVCSVRGNSMEPMLFDGDLVLLDRRQTDVRDGQIYGVVDIEGDTRIKRIELIDDGLLLRSENPDCRTELRHGDDANRVRIIGSLAWSGHSYDTSRQTPSRQTPRRRTMKHEWI